MPRRADGGKPVFKPRPCVTCGTEFTPTGPAAKFCSKACQMGTAVCESCGSEFAKRQTQGARSPNDNRYCSYKCRWAAARSRDSYGRYVNSDGYVILHKRWLDPTLRRDVNNNGYTRVNLGKSGRVLEHRWVMEQQLGRPLLPTEEVHHKNTVKTDNAPGNLELWDTSQPKGGRVEDKIEWALEFLARYGEVRFTRSPGDAR